MQDQTLDTPSKAAIMLLRRNNHTAAATEDLLNLSTGLPLQDSMEVLNTARLLLSNMEARATGHPLLSILHTASKVMADLLPATSLPLAGDSTLAHVTVTKGDMMVNKSVV